VSPRRTQNRFLDIEMPEIQSPFVNEPDTDFGLEQNRKWAVSILKEWKEREFDQIPLVIGSKEYRTEERSAVEKDPSRPNHDLYRYTLATPEQADQAITVATEAQESWGSVSLQERSKILADVAQEMRLHRGELIGAMIADTGKLIPEADTEISEAIDFLEYYRRSAEEFHAMNDLNWSPIGPVVITPPWNFPCAIPVGGIAAALAAGNTVIFKPSREAILVGWTLVQRFWEAGVPKNVLQFVTGKGSEIGDNLIKDERVKCIILTGATETAKMMLKKRPSLHLMAETGGKNAIIVTSLSDRDLAVNHILQSAFFHGGQKCSACSLLILEKEVYEDPHFRGQLYDGLSSLKVGSAWDLQSKINPLIHIPDETLARGLTTLDEGEKWLIQPKQDDNNPNLWTPGIKFGVTEKSFTYHNELFGPVLSVMCANNLEHAIQLANGTKYGLTSGIFSLDQREIEQWEKSIEVGNAYINRGVTGAIVRRQPFGGCKESSFGRTTKAGGPNYLLSLMDPTEKTLPKEHAEITSPLKILSLELKKTGVTTECFEKWEASIKSYLYHYAHYFSKDHDPSQVVGQDNILRYLPRKRMGFRVQEDDSLSDIMRVLAASKVCNTPIVVSGNLEQVELIASADWLSVFSNVTVIAESESEFVDRLKSCGLTHIRLISEPSDALLSGLAENSVNAILTPVCSNGRVELVHYLREMAISRDYHRYGNLGVREDEERSPVL
ncbi:MAG: aldehyde dehydrogenase family protein, partial [Waddliaceae bacterium]